MKKLKLMISTMLLSAAMATPVLAGSWQQNSTGYWYQNDDGSYPTNTWQWIDGNADGISECYYFDADGYCSLNCVTPDGYITNESGAWVVHGIVQTQVANPSSAKPDLSETQGAVEPTAVSTPDTATETAIETTTKAQVWLSATGSKYHKINNCGRMNPEKARQISLEDALNSGYEKCDKCY